MEFLGISLKCQGTDVYSAYNKRKNQRSVCGYRRLILDSRDGVTAHNRGAARGGEDCKAWRESRPFRGRAAAT